jgi:predicted nucleic acid-binding Zn finger protein
MSVSSIISALISCNFTIKHYVSRKIMLYLLIFTKSLWLHDKHFIALTKRESGRRIFVFVITDQDYPCQNIDQWPRKMGSSRGKMIRRNGSGLSKKAGRPWLQFSTGSEANPFYKIPHVYKWNCICQCQICAWILENNLTTCTSNVSNVTLRQEIPNIHISNWVY